MGEKKFCPQCGNKVEASVKFCPHCGADLTDVATAQPQTKANSAKMTGQHTPPKSRQQVNQVAAPKKQPLKKKTKVTLWLVAIIVVLFGGFYAWGSNHYSRNNQIDQIIVSLKNPQMGLAQYVTTDDHTIKVTNNALKPLQKYYQSHQTTANNLSMNLKAGGSTSQISLVQSGRYLLLFPKYTLHINTYTPQVETNHRDTRVLVNGKSGGQVKGSADSYYKKLSPLFPGKYHLEVDSVVSGRELKADSTVNVWSNKTINMNIKTATFSIASVPGGTIYINDKKVGVLSGNGSKVFKNYPITDNMEVYVTTTFGSQTIKSQLITDLPEAIDNGDSDSNTSDDVDFDDDDHVVLKPQWKGLIDKSDAEDLLKSDFNDPESEDFIGGSDNSSYQELRKMLKGFDRNDSTISYDMDCDIVSINPAPNDSSSVIYKITYTFEKDNGDEHTQVMLYKGAILQEDSDKQKIKSIGSGAVISDKTDKSGEDDDDD
ncbi:zinc-ribbon domain-containing protein [Lactobacillus sp. ESL0703]|uniref:zinc ribbon domain-containing protein n=1 Tax=Lactobacillus sp. ESL0703 TaxID=2983218 RepID=UPI0023FA4553|nr:zinc-ribbon domain-containing protein [Lactobacillus sp. ESL0703]MDF7669197.1 zinc-ribbon domain-containing protein [Lactobacillus sp. ESL0703]